eukprot:666267-Prymnesium_polylepis.1
MWAASAKAVAARECGMAVAAATLGQDAQSSNSDSLGGLRSEQRRCGRQEPPPAAEHHVQEGSLR